MMQTYFGLEVVRDKLVRLADIESLPFAAFWRDSSLGSTMTLDTETGESFVYLHDWENFCRMFFEIGRHRYL